MSNAKTCIGICCAAVCMLVSVAQAYQLMVPDPYPTIQSGIDHASNGDTVSVWGVNNPPFTYNENVVVQNASVFVVNRSFLPGQTSYDSSWDWVQIDARSLGPAVSVNADEPVSATIRGFTIYGGHGLAGCGGGVDIQGSYSACVFENHILNNVSYDGGGGICCWNPSSAYAQMPSVTIRGNLIEWNNGLMLPGNFPVGGILLQGGRPDSCVIVGNVVQNNTGHFAGGIAYWEGNSFSTNVGPYLLTDNAITGNTCAFMASYAGGGLRTAGGGATGNIPAFLARRNTIVGNSPSGCLVERSGYNDQLPPMDYGTREDPGYNVIMGNRQSGQNGPDTDFSVYCDLNYPTDFYAVGNYWGSIDTRDIRTRIVDFSSVPQNLFVDPVAASGKWFDVNVNSTCTTGVIVTGDLSVLPGVSLQLAPGDTLGFLLSPDYSCPGFDPTLCDLILQSDSTITAVGTSDRPILFKGRPNLGDPEVAGDWHGISVCSQSTAMFDHCIIRSAYNALDAFDGGSLTVDSSSIYNNVLCGVLTSGWASLCLVGNTISWNGVYGVRCIDVQPGTRIEGNTLLQNAVYGISCDICTSAQPSLVRLNRVTLSAPTPSALFGIDLRGVGASLAVDTNYVAGYPQAGIYEQTSSAPIQGDTIVNVQYDGVRCVSGSTPRVRRTMIDTCKTGVLVDQTSLPDLGDDEESPGLNSILLNNGYYVHNEYVSVPMVSLPAQYNWWGCAPPVSGKFIGLGFTDHSNWLLGPPPSGPQSGRISPLKVPKELVLDQNWPNPATGSLTIRYGIPKMTNVCLNVYDISGELVRTLVTNDKVKPGYYNINWNCRDDRDREIAGGVYFYRLVTSDNLLTAGGKSEANVKIKKLVIARQNKLKPQATSCKLRLMQGRGKPRPWCAVG